MRVTNTMLTNNSLLNVGKNKENYMSRMEQYTTQKKIQRPSDDPIIAVRSLKYRTNLSELTQYLEKNIPDALSWMDSTEYAMKQINTILTSMNEYCNKGANDTLELDDRNSIASALREYRDFIYEQQLNTDFGGRYVFSGYRTDTPVLFNKSQTNERYEITEKRTFEDVDSFNYVYGAAEYDATITNPQGYTAQAPNLYSGHKVMLGYSNLDSKNAAGTADYVTIQYTDATGTVKTVTANTVASKSGTPANAEYKVDADKATFIPETGELILGDDLYNTIRSSQNFTVQYNKTDFVKNDVRPEHYYDCKVTDLNTGEVLNYTEPEDQNINYEINFSQSLTVNTLANHVVGTEVARGVDRILYSIQSLEETEAKLEGINKRIEETDVNDKSALENLNELKSQVETEITLKEKVMQEAFSQGLTMTTDAEESVNIALADHGARYKRLQMTDNKLKDQETDFEEILSDNEDIDIGEAYIRYNEADLLYQASLSATSKLLKNSLLDFI